MNQRFYPVACHLCELKLDWDNNVLMGLALCATCEGAALKQLATVCFSIKIEAAECFSIYPKITFSEKSLVKLF